jgi:hypothetical protein
MTPSAAQDIVDAIEAAVWACPHPHALAMGADWCGLCGSRRFSRGWMTPHLRALLVRALWPFVESAPGSGGGEAPR